jgi:hypothetical protein
MEELSIVRKRVRLWPIVIALIALVLIGAAIFYAMNVGVIDDVGTRGQVETRVTATGRS